MSIEDSILTLAHAIGRLADAIDKTGAAPARSVPDEKPKATKPVKAEPAAEATPPAVAAIEQAQAALASAQQAEVPTYDSTKALLIQIGEKLGREQVVAMLAAAGLQDLKKGTPEQFKALTTAALAKLA